MSEPTSNPSASPSSSWHLGASWFGVVGLAVFFAIFLIAFPPLTYASVVVEIPGWMKFLGRFHFVALHLPVGVIVLAALMELFIFIRRKTAANLAPALNFTLMVGAWGAVIAVVFGSFLARKGGFNSAAFYAHQTFGIASASGIILTLMFRLMTESVPRLIWVYRGFFAFTFTVMSVGAHFGGNLVHGPDYLIKYAPGSIAKIVTSFEGSILVRFEPQKNQPGKIDPPPVSNGINTPASVTGATVYAALVAPILESKCYSCHYAEKSKGDLRLDTHELMLKGGENGKTLVVGQPEKSRMIKSMQLPLEDDDHMPPSNKPQPSKEEIALIFWWIKEGASKDLKVSDAKLPDELKHLAAKLMADVKGGSAGNTPPIILGLQQVAAKPAEAVAVTAKKPLAANSVVFNDIIAPILSSKCITCHSKEKTKSKLRMDTFADLMKGGSDGATTVIPNKPGESLMLKRIHLPLDDEDHMPPPKEKQPSAEEIALLQWWIETGASETVTLGAATKTPEIEGFIKKVALAQSSAAPDDVKKPDKPKVKSFTPAEKKFIEEVTARISALNASLLPLAQDTPQLRFSCINAADKFGDKELAELAPVAAHIVWVDLGRSKVTDAGLATIASMTNLERLHLENTAVTDAGLARLATLPQLEYLNLYGTKITDAGITKLSANKNLKKIFLWQTAATPAAAKKLEEAVPGLVVNTGQ